MLLERKISLKDERDKLRKVLDELVNYCFSLNIKDLNIDLKINKDYSQIAIKAFCESIENSKLEKLRSALNNQRQKEIEEYYWPLMGSDHASFELDLLGSFVDNASVYYENNYLNIVVKRIIRK